MRFWLRSLGGQVALPLLYQRTLVPMRACVVHLRNVERDLAPKMVVEKKRDMRQKLAPQKKEGCTFSTSPASLNFLCINMPISGCSSQA